MAENGETIRSSTTKQPSPPPSLSSPGHRNSGHSQTANPSTEGVDAYHHQKHSQLSSMCNGLDSSTSRKMGRDSSVKNGTSSDSGDVFSSSQTALSVRVKEECQQQETAMDDRQERDQDGPLDFSLRRRDSVSESFTDDSRTSSSISPQSYNAVNGQLCSSASSRHSPDDDHFSPNRAAAQSPRQPHLGQGHHQGEESQGHGTIRPRVGRSPRSSPDLNQSIGQGRTGPKAAFGGRVAGLRMPTNASLAAMGMMADGTGAGVTPATVAAMLSQNGGMMSSLTSLSTFVGDPRKLHVGNGSKMQRPFKAYPKEALQMPLGYLGLPGMNPLAGLDQSCLPGLAVSQDEVMSIYKQQLEFLKEREKHMMYMSKMMTGSPPAAATSNTSASNLPNNINGSSSSNNNGSVAHHTQPPSSIIHPNGPPPPLLAASASPDPASYFSPPTNTPTTPSLPPAHPPTTLSYSSHASNSAVHNAQFPTPTGPPLVSSTSSPSGAGSRKRPRTLPESQKDEAYWERRRKNNDAAKRSRDARRAKEDEIAIRAALLEQENLKLRVEVAALKTETARLRCLLYNT